MRFAASVLGIVGGLCGIFFAQLVVGVGMMLAIVTSATQGGELELGNEFYVGLAALVLYAIGVAGGVMVALRPIAGAVLLLVAAVGSSIATIAVNGDPAQQAGGTFVTEVFPYLGPGLLFVALALAAFELRGTARAAGSVDAAGRPSAVAAAPVVAAPALLASAVPMPILAEPSATSSSTAEIQPGTAFESLETQGEFVHVRGQGFEGFLPAWSVRRT